MSLYFVDTSALVKRYVREAGSAWVRGWVEPQHGNVIIISELTTVELAAALARRQREGQLPPARLIPLRDDFLLHVEEEYLVIALPTEVLHLAADLCLRYPLRTLDAIQLASARASIRRFGATPTFVSADQRLLVAAAAEGFPTDDPNPH